MCQRRLAEEKNQLGTVMKYRILAALAVSASFLGMSACSDVEAGSSNAETVKAWLSAGQVGQEATINAVKEHMADEGLFYRPRYVGFGFTYDNTDESGRMVVETIVTSGPASAVLQVGDEFVSVRGVEVNADNRDSGKLSFRGAPGEEVAAVIKRGDELMDIAVTRGKVESTISKADMIDWMSSGDGDDWGDDSFTLHEVVASEDVAYAWTTIANADDVTGNTIETHVVTRFRFNDDGKVVAVSNLQESRFILEQEGFSITR